MQNNKKQPIIAEEDKGKCEVKELEPLVITDFTAINWIRKYKNLPEIKKSTENLYFFGDWGKLSPEGKRKVYIKYIENTSVDGIFDKSDNDVVEELSATEKTIRANREFCMKFGILTKIADKKYRVDDKKISEWRKLNEN